MTPTVQCEECGDRIPEADATLERYPEWVVVAFCPDCSDQRRTYA